jgi:double-strand break repair protein MRE11
MIIWMCIESLILGFRHVALVQVHGTDFVLEPIPLRTVRPFIAEDLELRDVAEEENMDLNDQIEVMKLIRRKV